MINKIYDKLMRWLQNYKRWCRDVLQLRSQYMQPLINQFSTSETAKEELTEFRSRVIKAKAVLARPDPVSADAIGEQLMENLNLSARRSGPETSLKRARTRYKREHTL